MSDTVVERLPSRDAASGEPSREDLSRARVMNLLGLVTPIANLGMTRTAPRDLRWIGVGAGIVLWVAAWLAWRAGHVTLAASFAAAHFALVLVGLVNPRLPEGPARLWTKFGETLGKVMVFPIFGLLYYLVVTPTALLVRLFGTDPLRRKAPPQESYWIVREPAAKERFERMF